MFPYTLIIPVAIKFPSNLSKHLSQQKAKKRKSVTTTASHSIPLRQVEEH